MEEESVTLETHAFTRRKALKLLAGMAAGCATLSYALCPQAKDGDMIIIYFSHSGNTRAVAGEIQKLTQAPLAEIKPLVPYPENYNELVNMAEKQAAENFRPTFTINLPADLSTYDLVFLGFPIWAYTMPMIVYSFLEKYPLAGKKIAPFSTHMGSGLADAPEKIARLCPNAVVLPGLAIRGNNAANSTAKVRDWLRRLGLLK